MKALKYSEYKQNQALWLQSNFEKHNRIISRNQFMVMKYLDYLKIIGYKNDEKIKQIEYFLSCIDVYKLFSNRSSSKYNKEIERNLDKIIDGCI